MKPSQPAKTLLLSLSIIAANQALAQENNELEIGIVAGSLSLSTYWYKKGSQHDVGSPF